MIVRTLTFTCLSLLLTQWTAHAANVPAKKTESLAQSIPLSQLPEGVRDKVRNLAENATLSTRGTAESFVCKAEHYNYFLDHPERAVAAWRKLGAKCVSINVRGNQQYSWSDEHGSLVVWDTILRAPGIRMWLAEGKVKSGPIGPVVPVKVIIVLRYLETPRQDGATSITHQSDVFVQTDSKMISVVAKVFGSSAKTIAEDGLGQMQMFFSVLSWHMHRHPELVDGLLRKDN